MSLASAPFVGHVCPNTDDLRPDVDDLCDLPEPWRRLAYTLSIDSQHDCSQGFGHHPDFCRHAVWRQVVAERRTAPNRSSTP